jgi:hypothetical protein
MHWKIFTTLEQSEKCVAQCWRWSSSEVNGETRTSILAFSTLPSCRADAVKHAPHSDVALTIDARTALYASEVTEYQPQLTAVDATPKAQ